MYEFKIGSGNIQMDNFISVRKMRESEGWDLANTWYQFYLQQNFCDITFIDSSGKKTRAHAAALALSSPVFTRLRQHFQHVNLNYFYLCLVGVSSELLNDFLYFVYYGNINIDKHLSPSFLKLVNLFGIEIYDNLPFQPIHQEEACNGEEEVIMINSNTEPNDGNDALLRGLNQLRLNKILTDVIFICSNNEELEAHFTILAMTSPYFRSLFSTRQSRLVYIYMVDVFFDLLRSFLEFLYIGIITIKKQMAPEFLKLAEHFQIKVRTETKPLLRNGTVPTLQVALVRDPLIERVLQSPSPKRQQDISSDSSTPDFLMKKTRISNTGHTDNLQLPGSNGLYLSATSTRCARDTEEETNIEVQNSQTPSTKVDNSSNSKVILIDSQILREVDKSQIVTDKDKNNEQDDATPMNNVEPSVMIIEEDYSLIVLNDSLLIEDAENPKERNSPTSRGIAEKHVTTTLSSGVSLKQEVGSEPPIPSQPSVEENVSYAVLPGLSVLDRTIPETFLDSPVLTRSRHVVSRKGAKSLEKAGTHNDDSDSCESDELICF